MSRTDILWGGFLTSAFGAFSGAALALALDASGADAVITLSGGAVIASMSAAAIYLLLSRRDDAAFPHAAGRS